MRAGRFGSFEKQAEAVVSSERMGCLSLWVEVSWVQQLEVIELPTGCWCLLVVPVAEAVVAAAAAAAADRRNHSRAVVGHKDCCFGRLFAVVASCFVEVRTVGNQIGRSPSVDLGIHLHSHSESRSAEAERTGCSKSLCSEAAAAAAAVAVVAGSGSRTSPQQAVAGSLGCSQLAVAETAQECHRTVMLRCSLRADVHEMLPPPYSI